MSSLHTSLQFEEGAKVVHKQDGSVGIFINVERENLARVLWNGEKESALTYVGDLDFADVPAATATATVSEPALESKTLLDWALDAVRRGFYVFPCDPNGKEPAGEVVPNGVLGASNDPNVVRGWWAKNPNYNPAIALGPSNLVGYDFDTVAPFADLPATLTVRSGRNLKPGEAGGIHMYYRGSAKTHSMFVPPVEPVIEKLESDKSGDKVAVRYDALGRKVGKHGVTVGEIRSRGAYLIWAGAIHKSGNPYTIINDVPLAESPEQNTEKVYDSGPAIGSDEQNTIAEFVEDAFEKAGVNYKAPVAYSGGFKWLIDCPWEHEHTGGKGISEGGSSSAVFMTAQGKLGYQCQHAHCENREWKELRGWMEEKVGEKLPFGTPTTNTVLVAGVPPARPPQPIASAVPEVLEWSEVEPLDDQLRPVAPFRPDFLPDSIRPWVVDVSERMSVPLDFTGICALTTIAGVIGRRVFVCPKAKDKEWKESIALSGAVVAESGKTKTPTWKTFTNIAVEKEADWQEEHKRKAAKYAEDSKAWEALDKKNKETEKKTGVVQNTPPAPEEPAPSRRLLLNDATPEKMHDVMKSNPCGLFYLRDELSSWVAEFDKEGREVQRGMFLAAMNGNDPYTVDRIGREGGSATMCVSVFGGFQPDMFRDFLNNATNVSDGTIPRFPLLVWPDESDLPIVDRSADDSAKQQFRRVIRELAEMNEKQILIHFSTEAQPIFDSWLVSLNQKIHAEENSGKRSHLSKYKGALPKIAALLQIVDLISNGPLAGTHVIDSAHINKAIDLLAYLETHMHRIYGCIQTPIQKAESAIAKRLRNGDLTSGFTIRAIQRKHWRDLSRPEYIDLALETLVEKGWLRDLPKSEGRGRPTIAWEINPGLRKED